MAGSRRRVFGPKLRPRTVEGREPGEIGRQEIEQPRFPLVETDDGLADSVSRSAAGCPLATMRPAESTMSLCASASTSSR